MALKEIDRSRLVERTTAFDYQREAVNFVTTLPYAAIFFEQGLGKTKIAIDLALTWLRANLLETVLIVTKKSLIKNWVDEFNIHSHVRPRTITSDRAANHRAFFSQARIYIAGYESVKVEEDKIRQFCAMRTVGVILDESQKLKNPESALTKAFMRLAPDFQRRVIMTGTPMANRPYDIWSQIYFLDQGDSLGSDFDDFKSKLEIGSAAKTSEYVTELQSVFPRISSFTVQQTKRGSGLMLPGKIYETVVANWSSQQREIYDAVRTELQVEITKEGRRIVDRVDAILKRLLRLVQVTSNPGAMDESYEETPGKIAALDALVSEIRSRHEKAVVWTSFVSNCRYLKARLAEYGAVEVHGSLSIDVRNKHIDQFKSDDSIGVLVATPAAAKEGLTLTVANHAIFYDRSFSLDDYLQAQDRIHRISQEKPCYIYNIVLPDSIDQWVDALINVKRAAARIGMGESDPADLETLESVDLTDLLKGIFGKNGHVD